MAEVKLKIEGRYFNHNVKQNKNVDVTFKMPYTELTNYLQSVQMLNENVTFAAKIGSDKKPIKLGTFMIKELKIDGDGEGVLKINSQLDYTELDGINQVAIRNEEPLFLLLKCNIEDLGEDEDDEEIVDITE